MATFKLTLNPNYVPNWTTSWEAVREFVQNGLDARDKGHEFRAVWDPKKNQLKLSNQGAKLSRSDLLLGSTSKADDPTARGHFGEGFKLAMLVLARNKVKVKIRTGSETWTPEIVYSEEYGSDLLQIRTSPSKDDGHLTVVIDSVSEESWTRIKQLVIPLRDTPPKHISTSDGDILLDPSDKGRIFVKGISVFEDPKLAYGYDFKKLDLDRDRKMANVYSLEWAIRNVMTEAIGADKFAATKLLELMNTGGTRESSCFDTYDIPQHIGDKVKEAFCSAFGKDTLPFQSADNAVQARSNGMRSVVATKALEKLFESEIKLASAITQNALSVAAITQPDELTEAEMDIWKRGMRILRHVRPGLSECAVQVVTFAAGGVRGSLEFKERLIRIARSELASIGKFLSTMSHELAHVKYPDHSHEHAAEVETLFEACVDSLVADTMWANR